MIVFFFGEIFYEMHMLSISHINGTQSFSIEFMEMTIGEIGAEFYFMEVILFSGNGHGFTGNGTESVIVTVITFTENSGAAGELVHMFLLVAVMLIHHGKISFCFNIEYVKGREYDNEMSSKEKCRLHEQNENVRNTKK